MQNTKLFSFILVGCFAGTAMASPCTSGNQAQNRFLKSCTIESTPDLYTGQELSNINVCVSTIEKSGGPFGGDTITWFYSNISMSAEDGSRITYEFNGPDGRHNFRSPIDYTVIDFTDGFYFMESHRTRYPENSRKGVIDLHNVNFNSTTQELTFSYQRRDGIMFGRWNDIHSFRAVCR